MLLMEEGGFLDNMSAEELLVLARNSPDLVRQAVFFFFLFFFFFFFFFFITLKSRVE